MKTMKSVMGVCCYGLIAPMLWLAPVQAEPLRYIKQQQGEQQLMLWEQVELKNYWLIEAREDERLYRNYVLANGDTLRWELESEAVQLQAHLSDGNLLVQGNNGGVAIDQQQDLQGLPWYQPLSYSLARFTESNAEKIEFWMVRPDNFALIKMQAVKKGQETLMIKDDAISVERVTVRPTGMLAMMWQADYWFASDNRLFLKYQSSGAMGLAETSVQLERLTN